MKINHSFQIKSLLKMIPPPLLGELFCGGKRELSLKWERTLLSFFDWIFIGFPQKSKYQS
jgi:hypothetical protein